MTQQELFVQMAMQAWNLQNDRTIKAFNSYTDEELYTEIAPGKNRLIYLLGHLTSVHDRMQPLLGLGSSLYPQLEESFLVKADRAVDDLPSAKELREYWAHINEVLAQKLNSLTPDEWFEKHTAVSEEDFKKEPHRNRLNVLISRTNHLAYHLGQLVLVKKA